MHAHDKKASIPTEHIHLFIYLSGWQSVSTEASELLASLQGMWLGALCPGGETGRAPAYPGIKEASERKKKLSQQSERG